ncbi:hypothetical protein JTB14_034242 [Gonioctena quinquepunctata]|nr:hypothetical protein JTB14_034242 [Gonioctena quinquepunctata]
MELEQSLKQSQTSEEKITELSGEINSLSAAKEDISKQLRESQNTVLELSANKEKLDTELNSLSMTSSGINEKLGELNLQLKEKDEALENTKKEYQTNLQAKDKNLQEIEQLAKDLREMLEKQKTEYETKIKSLSDSESQMKKIVEQSNREAVKVEGLQNNLKNTVSKLTEKEAELNSRNQEVAKLREDLKKASSKEIITNGSGEHPEQNSLLEEKLMIEGQVAFLNSIIVDMQKKNEEQKARIEILEMGYNSSAADELANLGFTTQFRQPAPRMYCDICEEFDIHETEDCPTQAEDGGDMVSSSQLGKEAKEKPSPRPYCETCEVFGHSTEDCTDQEF